MQAFSRPVELAPGAVVGGAKPTLLAGPCVVESYDICARIVGAGAGAVGTVPVATGAEPAAG